MGENDLTCRLDLAVSAADSGGRVAADYFERFSFEVQTKRDGTPVTIADRETEDVIRRRIEREFPDDEIFGEELPPREGKSGFRWIIDPIDGTKSFIHGVPLFGTMIGVEHDGQCVIGAVNMPVLGDCVYAARGLGAWYVKNEGTPRPARVSSIERLEQGLFCCGSVTTFVKERRAAVFEELRAASKLSRGWGDCYGYVLVATGRAEVMVDPALSLWDMAALPTIMTEAGGTFTNWQGEATIYGHDGIATNGHVLQQVLAVTRGR